MPEELLATLTNKQLAEVRSLDFCRYLKALHYADGSVASAADVYQQQYPRNLSLPIVAKSVELSRKAAVPAGTTSDSTWAGPLAGVPALTDAFLGVVRPKEVLGQLPGIVAVGPGVPVPIWVSADIPASLWIGQNVTKPISQFHFATASVPNAKLQLMIIVTRELLKFGRAGTEEALKAILVSQLTLAVDAEFLDPTKAPVAGISPGSITNAGTAITTTGNAVQDVNAVLAALVAARPFATPVLILAPAHVQALVATGDYPELTYSGGVAAGARVIVSGGAGSVITAVDPSVILVSDSGVEIQTSQNAAIVMDSAPAAGASATAVSMFQTDSIAVRCERFVSWAVGDALGVQYTELT